MERPHCGVLTGVWLREVAGVQDQNETSLTAVVILPNIVEGGGGGGNE